MRALILGTCLLAAACSGLRTYDSNENAPAPAPAPDAPAPSDAGIDAHVDNTAIASHPARPSDAGAASDAPLVTLFLATEAFDDPTVPQSGGNAVQTYQFEDGTPITPTPTVGSCTVWGDQTIGLPRTTLVDSDLGTVTVSGRKDGADVFARIRDSDTPGYASSLDPSRPPFDGGEELVFDTTGSADFPAMHMTMTMPDPLYVDVAPLHYGQDFSVHWRAAHDPGTVAITLETDTDDGATFAECVVADDGTFTIPAGVTGQLRGDNARVRVLRMVTQRKQPPDSRVVFEWTAQISQTRTLSVQ